MMLDSHGQIAVAAQLPVVEKTETALVLAVID
jgi:hypothetical protein